MAGALPRPHSGSLQHSPGPLAGFKGPISEGRKDGKEGQGRREGEGRVREEGREEKERGGEGCVMDVRGDGRPCTVVQPILS